MHLQPSVVVSGQTKPAEGLTTFTRNKEPVSPVPLVMLLPVPSMSASDSIQNPQKLNSGVSKQSLSAPQVLHISLPSTKSSVGKESDKIVLLKDMASHVPGSNILIPLTSVKNGKSGWTLLEGPCTSGSVTNIYAVKKENEQVVDIKLKPTLYVPQLNASNGQKNKVLSKLEILQVLNVMKTNVCGDKTKENLSSLTSPTSHNAEMKADDGKQGGSKLESSNPSLEKNSNAQLTTNMESLSVVKMQPHCPVFNSSVVMLDSSPVKNQREEFVMPNSSIHSLSFVKFSLNPDELPPKSNVQKADRNAEGEHLGLDSEMIELGDESDVAQCETCGKMILEKDLVQHTMDHSVSSVLTFLGTGFE